MKTFSEHVREQEIATFWQFLRHLHARGWSPYFLDCGEEKTYVWKKPFEEAKKILTDLVFNLDESHIAFIPTRLADQSVAPIQRNQAYHSVLSPEELIADYSYAKGDTDGFSAAVEAFHPSF